MGRRGQRRRETVRIEKHLRGNIETQCRALETSCNKYMKAIQKISLNSEGQKTATGHICHQTKLNFLLGNAFHPIQLLVIPRDPVKIPKQPRSKPRQWVTLHKQTPLLKTTSTQLVNPMNMSSRAGAYIKPSPLFSNVYVMERCQAVYQKRKGNTNPTTKPFTYNRSYLQNKIGQWGCKPCGRNQPLSDLN